MPRVSSKDKYTEQVFELFKRRGLMLNMEQIAHELGLTKKTLYNNFNSKPELIGTVLHYFYSKLEKEIYYASVKSENAIEALFKVSAVTDRMNFYSRLIQENLKSGIEEGLYRETLNIEFSTLFYTSAIDLFYRWDNEHGFKYFEDTILFHKELVAHHLHSVVNERGLKLLEKYK